MADFDADNYKDFIREALKSEENYWTYIDQIIPAILQSKEKEKYQPTLDQIQDILKSDQEKGLSKFLALRLLGSCVLPSQESQDRMPVNKEFVTKLLKYKVLLESIRQICFYRIEVPDINRGSTMFKNEGSDIGREIVLYSMELIKTLALTWEKTVSKSGEQVPTQFNVIYNSLLEHRAIFTEENNYFDEVKKKKSSQKNTTPPPPPLATPVPVDTQQNKFESSSLGKIAYESYLQAENLLNVVFQQTQIDQFVQEIIDSTEEPSQQVFQVLTNQIEKMPEDNFNSEQEAIIKAFEYYRFLTATIPQLRQKQYAQKTYGVFRKKLLIEAEKSFAGLWNPPAQQEQQIQEKPQQKPGVYENQSTQKDNQWGTMDFNQKFDNQVVNNGENHQVNGDFGGFSDFNFNNKVSNDQQARQGEFQFEKQEVTKEKDFEFEQKKQKKENSNRNNNQFQPESENTGQKNDFEQQETENQPGFNHFEGFNGFSEHQAGFADGGEQKEVKVNFQDDFGNFFEQKQAQQELQIVDQLMNKQTINQFNGFENSPFQNETTQNNNQGFEKTDYFQEPQQFNQKENNNQWHQENDQSKPNQFDQSHINQQVKAISKQQNNSMQWEQRSGFYSKPNNFQQNQGTYRESFIEFSDLSKSDISIRDFPLRNTIINNKEIRGRLHLFQRQTFQILEEINISQAIVRRFKIANLKTKSPLIESSELQVGIISERVFDENTSRYHIRFDLFIGNKADASVEDLMIELEGEYSSHVFLKNDNFPNEIKSKQQLKISGLLCYSKTPYALINANVSGRIYNKNIMFTVFLPNLLPKYIHFSENAIAMPHFRSKWRSKRDQIIKSDSFALNKKVIRTPMYFKRYYPQFQENMTLEEFVYHNKNSACPINYKLRGTIQLDIPNIDYMVKFIIRPNFTAIIQIIPYSGFVKTAETIIDHFMFLFGQQ